MSFLSLFALFGLGLGALPILFHLKRRNVKEVQSISSLMFLKATPVPQKQSRKMENWLLLLLRLLALCCIVIAFSRPVWLSNLILEQGLQREMVTWVVDTSASMDRPKVQTLLKKAYEKEIQKIQANDYFELISFSNQPQVILSYQQWENTPEPTRLQLLKDEWLKLAPSGHSSQLANGLLFADQRQTQTWTQFDDFKKLAKKRMVVFSDLTENLSLEGLEQLKQSKALETKFYPLNPEDHWNARPTFKQNPKPGHAPELGIHFIHGHQKQTLELELSIDGKKQYSTSLECEPESQQMFTWPEQVPYQSDKTYQLTLKGDPETFDNTVFYTPSQPDLLHVMHYSNQNEAKQSSSRFFWEMGLKSDPKLKLIIHQQLSDLREQKKALLIIEKDPPREAWPKVQSLLKRGSAALILINSNISAEFLSNLCQHKLNIKAQQHPEGLGIKKIDFKASIFKPFSDPSFRDFSAIHIWKSHTLEGLQDQVSFSNLIQLDNNQPWLLEQNTGNGKLWLMTSDLSEAYSNFSRSSKFLPFLFSLVDHSLTRQSFQSSYHTGDTFLSPEKDIDLSRLEKLFPTTSSKTILSFTDRRGNYQIKTSSGAYYYSVNLPEEESHTRSMDLMRLNYLKSFHQTSSNGNEKTREPLERKNKFLAQLEAQQKLWQSFLIAAFVFVVLETTLAAVNSKFTQPMVQS